MNGQNVDEGSSDLTIDVKMADETNDVEDLLGFFAKEFVCYFEDYSHEYYLRLKEKKKKSGKWAELLGDVLDVGKGGTEAIPEPLTKAVSVVLINILQKIVYAVGSKFNREQVKKMTEKLYEMRDRPDIVREILVEAAIDIFRRYERQLVTVTVDGSAKRALEKVAEDAVHRITNYLKNNPGEQLSVDTLTKGLLRGSSKRGFFVKGHKLDTKWKTSEMFDEKTNKYGGRLLFEWEKRKMATSDDLRRQGNIADNYVYKLTPGVCERVKKDTLAVLNDSTSTNIEGLDSLKETVKEDFEELSKVLNDNLSAVKELFDEIDKKLNRIYSNVDETLETVKEVHEILVSKNLEGKNDNLVWFRVRDSVPNYTGRKRELEELHEKMQGGHKRWTAITGPSGMGKTELALRYIHEYGQFYERVIWINAKESTTLEESFKTLAQDYIKMTMKEIINGVNKEKGVKKIAESVYHYYANAKVLFVFDSVNNWRQIVDYLPKYRQNPHGDFPSVLITSNNRDWGDDMEILDLDVLTVEDAVKLVRRGLDDKFNIDTKRKDLTKLHGHIQEDLKCKKLPKEEMDDGNSTDDYLKNYRKSADGIVKKQQIGNVNIDELLKLVGGAFETYYNTVEKLTEMLDYFPLAIEQSIALINYQRKLHKSYSIGDFLDDYGNKIESLLKSERFNGIANTYEKTTYTAYTITLDKIDHDNSDNDNDNKGKALEILNIIGYMSSDNIPVDFFGDGKNTHREALRLLHEYSLVKISDDGDFLSIHRLLQEVVRLEIKGVEGKEEEILRKALQMIKGNTKMSYTHVTSLWSFVVSEKNTHESLIDEFVESLYLEEMTPLNLLCLYGYGEAVRLIVGHLEKTNLVKLHMVINKKDVFLFVPILHAAWGGHLDIVKLLRQKHVVDDETAKQCLHLAGICGHVDIVRYFIEDEKVRLDATYSNFSMPFQLAVFLYGHVDLVKYVLGLNKEVVFMETYYGENCLHLSALSGQLDLFRYLVEEVFDKKCKVDSEDNRLWTPLHCAVQNGHTNIVEYLINDHNLDPKRETRDRQNCLHIAAFYGHLHLVKYLVEVHSMKVSREDSRGSIPLYLAAQMGHVEVVKYFVDECHVDVKWKRNGSSCLHAAAWGNHLPMVKYLVEVKGLDVHLKDSHGCKPSDCAKTAANYEILKYLKDQEDKNEEQSWKLQRLV